MTTTLNVMPKDTQHPPRREAERRDRDANPKAVKIETRDLSFFYGANQVLFDVSMMIRERSVTALIGPLQSLPFPRPNATWSRTWNLFGAVDRFTTTTTRWPISFHCLAM